MSGKRKPAGMAIAWDEPTDGSPPDGRMPVDRVFELLEQERTGRTKAATVKRQASMLGKIARARELRASGLKPSQIAVRMSHELDYAADAPLSERQVRRWLADRKGDATT